MNILYHIGVKAYFLGVKVAAAFGHRKAKLMEEGQRDCQAHLASQLSAAHAESREVIWFHAASLGEFEQGRPLIEAIREKRPTVCIVQTFFSPSGYEVRKQYKGADVVCYLPYDSPQHARWFLDLVRPSRAYIVKYEFWGSYLEALAARQIPTYLVSGIFRPNQVFFGKMGWMMRPILPCFSHFFVQDDTSRSLLQGVGIAPEKITLAGDTRFDRVLAICQQAKDLAWAEEFVRGASCVMVAGSTWPPDEAIILDHFNRHPEMRLIIAPHEIHEARVNEILARLQRPAMRYSQLDMTRLHEVDVLIIDAIGFLSSIYRYGQIAYVGGGFGAGIHNTLEAAVYGIPVLFGPRHTAFREAIGLLEAGGGFTLSDATHYDSLLNRFLTDPAALAEAGTKAGKYVAQGAGATHTILQHTYPAALA